MLADTFTFENFEGPLDLLWHLINRHEIDIYQISIKEITEQFLSKQKIQEADLDRSAEFIALAASFIWFKSKALLPKHEQQLDQPVEEELDPNFDIIHHLIDYCHFKQAAKQLAEREQQQGAFYLRGIENSETKKNLGINHLTLEDLACLFQQILAKAEPLKGTIQEEEWRVSDKIQYLRECLLKHQKLDFAVVFNYGMGRIELIVTFLALLEMMKSGDAKVINDSEEHKIYILGSQNHA